MHLTLTAGSTTVCVVCKPNSLSLREFSVIFQEQIAMIAGELGAFNGAQSGRNRLQEYFE